MHRASRPGLSKPVLICILACSLAFYAITCECGTFTKIVILKIKSVALHSLVSLFYLFVAENVVTHGRTDKPSTVTLSVHACRGLKSFSSGVGVTNRLLLYSLCYCEEFSSHKGILFVVDKESQKGCCKKLYRILRLNPLQFCKVFPLLQVKVSTRGCYSQFFLLL